MSIVVAFSGGLDTSFCVPYLKETHNVPVYTATINTGGFSDAELAAIKGRSTELGADGHFLVDAKEDLFEIAIQYLIKGNVLRGGVYPLCVGPDRVVQAMGLVDIANKVGADTVAHGSTGAGNDQIRFDSALSILAQGLTVLAPIRELGLTRRESSEFLKSRGFGVSNQTTEYSINIGLWGMTIGGKETTTTTQPLPEDAWPTPGPEQSPDYPRELSVSFDKGIPTAIDGVELSPIPLIEELNACGFEHAIGRGMHVGDTILGIKGRVAFQAPAARILIVAHSELEKITLSKWQQVQKKQLADFYGSMLHEAHYFDPVMRDTEAFLDTSQSTVSGTVFLKLYKGSVSVLGAESPFSLFSAGVATYGEQNTLWDGRDAQGYAKIASVQSVIAVSTSKTAPAEVVL